MRQTVKVTLQHYHYTDCRQSHYNGIMRQAVSIHITRVSLDRLTSHITVTLDRL